MPASSRKRKRADSVASSIASGTNMYTLKEVIPGNLRQLRATLRDVRMTCFSADEDAPFSLYMAAPGKAAPDMTVQQMCMAFVLRRNERRNLRNYADAAKRMGEQVPVPEGF